MKLLTTCRMRTEISTNEILTHEHLLKLSGYFMSPPNPHDKAWTTWPPNEVAEKKEAQAVDSQNPIIFQYSTKRMMNPMTQASPISVLLGLGLLVDRPSLIETMRHGSHGSRADRRRWIGHEISCDLNRASVI